MVLVSFTSRFDSPFISSILRKRSLNQLTDRLYVHHAKVVRTFATIIGF